ncbi:MAG: hypothetical protein H6555_02225 [Lewinellaceae bacterium]|nr:hypothetical protein [Lewinellaceae bacterium]
MIGIMMHSAMSSFFLAPHLANLKKTLTMKNKIVLIALTLWSMGCNQDTLQPVIQASVSQRDIMDAVNELSYLDDFVVPGSKQKPPQPGKMAFDYLGIASKKEDPALMRKMYPQIKRQLQTWISQDPQEYYNMRVQHIALRYLRYYFLDQENKKAEQETLFLFQLIMDHGALDMDVMADAYVKVEKWLSAEQKERYLKHIQEVYARNAAYVQANWEEWRDTRESSTDPGTRSWYYAKAKFWQRNLASGNYAMEKLGLTNTSR